MRASLLANATTATFRCTRAVKPRNQLPSGVAPASRLGKAARTPWISNLRRYLRCASARDGGLNAGEIARGRRAEVFAFALAQEGEIGIATDDEPLAWQGHCWKQTAQPVHFA